MVRPAVLAVLCALAAGCGGTSLTFDEPVDTGTPDDATAEAALDSTPPDSSVPPDSGATDTSVVPVDTGVLPIDTGVVPPTDTGTPGDTGVVVTDTGTVDAVVTCTDPGAVAYAGHCYFLVTTAATWDGARTACAARGAKVHLVTITSSGERDVVNALGAGTERWIGYSRPVASLVTKASFKWVTGEVSTFDNWGTGEPNGTGECARMMGDGTWADRYCTYTFAYVCEREP